LSDGCGVSDGGGGHADDGETGLHLHRSQKGPLCHGVTQLLENATTRHAARYTYDR
jgi:hypothetical protein